MRRLWMGHSGAFRGICVHGTRGQRARGRMRFAESMRFVAFSCITILGVMARIGFSARRVEAGTAASPFCRRAVWRSDQAYPNIMRTNVQEVKLKFRSTG